MNGGVAVSSRERTGQLTALAASAAIECAAVWIIVQWIGAQWIAWRLGYAAALSGDVLIDLGELRRVLALPLIGWIWWMVGRGIRRLGVWQAAAMLALLTLAVQGVVYSPFAFWRWRRALLETEWAAVAESVGAGLGVGWAIAAVAIVVTRAMKAGELEPVGAHGTGRLGDVQDLKQAGIVDRSEGGGLPLGFVEGRQQFHDGEEHALVMGATGGDKTAFGFVPALLGHRGGVCSRSLGLRSCFASGIRRALI